jgi:putative membrane protein
MAPEDLAGFNAILNSLASALLLAGYFAIRARKEALHKACMLAALAVSATFLASYLYLHLVVKQGQPTYFSDRYPDAAAWLSRLYLVILGTHTVLAILATPLALVTAYLGLRDRRASHTRLARWTFPIWLYVSLTGVVVYWMLYRL